MLSDGGEKPQNRLFFSGASKQIHKIWSDAFYQEYSCLPSSFLLPYKSIFVTTHKVSDKIMTELKRVCPNFKTSPRNKSKELYLSISQPSIKYIFTRPKLEQQIAIRLWANTEGSIGIRLDKKNKLITPYFQIACANPSIIKELQRLCKINMLNLTIIKDKKNWAGVGRLKSTSIKSAINFLKMGGFIKGTKISSKSKSFKGLDKQEVLFGILEFMLKQRKEDKYRIDDMNKIYKHIKDIVLKKEFKEESYYLDSFKKLNSWTFRGPR